MSWQTMEDVIVTSRKCGALLVDITGGSAEIHPHFRKFVRSLRDEGLNVQVRTNLTIMSELGYEDLPEFFTENKVMLVASMPCYLEENVDSQRGKGAYSRSTRVLRTLNSFGYGISEHLPLNLVYNPTGPFLPSNQSELEAAYKKELDKRFGISFNRLFTITNMPLGRFQRVLEKKNKADEYAELLKRSFNPETIDDLMCRHQISVGWDGRLFDCDFNLALDMPVHPDLPVQVKDLDPELHTRRKIVTGPHCFGCTAGFGSSCGGALAS